MINVLPDRARPTCRAGEAIWPFGEGLGQDFRRDVTADGTPVHSPGTPVGSPRSNSVQGGAIDRLGIE